MSRLGDLIHTERLRQNLSLKQVAKKTGVSEKYLQEVEGGKRIIQDEQARRILKQIGSNQQAEGNFSLEDIAATVDLNTLAPPTPAPGKKTAAPAASSGPISGSIWLDALSDTMKRVPVYNRQMKETGFKLMPIKDNKVEGAPADKVFYMEVFDKSMEGFRFYEGDLLFIIPTQSPVNEAFMLIEYEKKRLIRKVVLLDGAKVLLIQNDREPLVVSTYMQDVHFIGRCARLESLLP